GNLIGAAPLDRDALAVGTQADRPRAIAGPVAGQVTAAVPVEVHAAHRDRVGAAPLNGHALAVGSVPDGPHAIADPIAGQVTAAVPVVVHAALEGRLARADVGARVEQEGLELVGTVEHVAFQRAGDVVQVALEDQISSAVAV